MAEVQNEIDFPWEGGRNADTSLSVPYEIANMRAPGQACFLKLQSQLTNRFIKRDRREIDFRIERGWMHDLLTILLTKC